MKTADISTEVYEMLHGLGATGLKIVPQAKLNTDLGIDSLDRIQIGLEIERCTGKKVEDAEIDKVRTVGDLQLLFNLKNG